jgi:hypothetical protein
MNKLTILISTSPIPSNPKTIFIDAVINSIKKYLFIDNEYKIIIACDGTDKKNERYEKYIENLKNKYKDNKNILIAVNNKKGHLSGNLRNAVKYADTKFLLIVQHDLIFISKSNPNLIIKDMIKYPQLKHIRFNKRDNMKQGWDNTPLYASKKVNGNYTYIMTEAWIDQNHICRKSYFEDTVLGRCDRPTFMENILNRKAKGKHEEFGTFILGDINEKNKIVHLDGAESRHGSAGKILKENRQKYLEI